MIDAQYRIILEALTYAKQFAQEHEHYDADLVAICCKALEELDKL